MIIFEVLPYSHSCYSKLYNYDFILYQVVIYDSVCVNSGIALTIIFI